MGQRQNPIPYPVKTIGCYFALALTLYAAMQELMPEKEWASIVTGNALLLVYVGIVAYNERALLGKVIKKVRR